MTEIDNSRLSDLVVKYQNGDGKAFEEIYNMTYRTARFTALKILNNNESDADDVMQDCYIKVMKKIGTLKDPSSFMSWFNQIVANQSKSVIRKNNPHFFEKEDDENYESLDDEWAKEFSDFIDDDYSDNNGDTGMSLGESKKRAFIDEASSEDYESFLPESDLEKEELCRTVMNMIDGLSDEKKTAVVLFYYNNMTTREISETVGVSENTIKSRLVQAKKDISKAVVTYEKKNGKLLGLTPAAVIVWALKTSAVSIPVAPYVAAGIAAAGTAAAAGTGIAAKIIAGMVIAGVVAGGSVVGTKVMKNHNTEESTTAAFVTEYTENYTEAVTEAATDELIPTRPLEEYTVAENKLADTYFEEGTLKYGVDYKIQRYANKNGDLYSGRPVLNRKNYKASYEDLLPAATENSQKYNTYIRNAVSDINEKRAAAGKAALVADDILTEQANVRAEEVAWTERDTALRPDGTSYTSLFERNGYSEGSGAEIRRVDYSSYNTAIASILKDKAINGDFEKIGVGVAQNPESQKLVFVVHLYSAEDGKSDQTVSWQDRLIAWQNEKIDGIQDSIMDNSRLDELERKGKENPVLKKILEYDFHNDLILEYLKKFIDALSNFTERIGE